MAFNDLPDDIPKRETEDIAYRTKQVLVALNGIDGMNAIVRDNTGISYNQLDGTYERLSELLTSYAYALGYKNTIDNVSSPVEISDIENEIRDNGDIFDTSIFEIAQNEYDRGAEEANQ
mgnify:CR=1 FL=1